MASPGCSIAPEAPALYDLPLSACTVYDRHMRRMIYCSNATYVYVSDRLVISYHIISYMLMTHGLMNLSWNSRKTTGKVGGGRRKG